MGWSDVALSLQGPIVQSLNAHFIDRWYELLYNYIDGALCTDMSQELHLGRKIQE